MSNRSLSVLAALCLTAGSMMAAPPQKQQSGDGIVAAVDSNGNLRQPTAEEMRQAELQFHFPSRPSVMRITSHATGKSSMALDESFDHYYMARTDEDGTLVFTCTDDTQEALRFVATTASVDTIMRIHRTDKRQGAERE
jgi:hypothetical protein